MRVGYAPDVSERRIDRDAWADEIKSLIATEAGGNKTRFGKMIDLSVKSIDRWLDREVDVREENVRRVCRALQIPVQDMLLKVGYYQPADFEQAAVDQTTEDDRAATLIRDSDLSPAAKRQLLAHLAEQREAHEQQRLADAERMIELFRRAAG